MTLPAHSAPAHDPIFLTLNHAGAEPRNRQAPIELHHPRGIIVTLLSNSAVRSILSGDRSRVVFAAMLRRAFPGDSDNERAERGAPVLGISVRHFRRLLNCEHDAKVSQVLAVLILVGFEAAIKMTGQDGR